MTTETSSLASTPLHSRHVALGGKMVPFAGYSLPIQYSGITLEHAAVRGHAGLFDVSHMGELRVRGAGAVGFVDRLVTNDLERVAFGQAMYTCATNEEGTVLDDLIIYKWAEDDVLVVCNASNREKIAAHFAEHAAREPSLHFEDESDSTALLALQGPRALEILGKTDATLASLGTELGTFRFKSASLIGRSVTIARTGYTGEDGVEIFARNEDAGAIWDALLAAGGDAGLLPAGLGCRDTLRLEARLSLYGHEIDETTNPLEAGLGWIVKLDKPAFLGRDALRRIKDQGLTRRIVGFEMVGRGVARADYPLLAPSGEVVGRCTSGSPSPTLGKAIGLGYLPLALTEIGTSFSVDCRGKAIEARVVRTPFYRRPG